MKPTTTVTATPKLKDAEMAYCFGSLTWSAARRIKGAGAGSHRSAWSSSRRSPMNFEGREPRVPAKYAAMVDWPHGTRSANCC